MSDDNDRENARRYWNLPPLAPISNVALWVYQMRTDPDEETRKAALIISRKIGQKMNEKP